MHDIRRSKDHKSLRVNYWLYSSRFLLICQLEDLDLILTLKEFLALTQNTAQNNLSNQVRSALRATYKTCVPKIFKCFSTIKISNIFGMDFLIIFCLTKSPSLNSIVFLKKILSKDFILAIKI